MKATGGYLFGDQHIVRTGLHAHTKAVDGAVSQRDLDVTNSVQDTPWRINRWVLDLMMQAWAEGRPVGGLDIGEPKSLPTRMADDVWEALDDADKKQHLSVRAEIHAANASLMGRSQAVLDALAVADELRDEPAIYYPCVRDFRLRIYPQATRGPNPQGNDIAKSLLMFADGLPLGAGGMFWLCVRAANTYGQDKLTLEERVLWASEHMGDILDSAADPFGCAFWQDADEPWGFLATCHELSQAWQLEDPTSFVSHLPVPMDGTCNGLQHLSAMGLDPIGAAATNLRPGVRQDIYIKVAQRVSELVQDDVLAGVDEARVWHGKVDRKVVKRAVMTTPYGVTDRGIAKQLIDDEVIPDCSGIGVGKSADYLRGKLVQALTDTVVSAKSIMAWLQATASALAKAGIPFRWTTPMGSTVQQAYRALTMVQVKTLCGKVSLGAESKDAPLNDRKQALGAAPNFIHSFDAAHVGLTVEEGTRQGITSWALIHDSYGTHAANTWRLAAILRETFIAIYSVDRLKALRDEIAGYAPYVALPELPTRGDFDINEVREATFFFS